MNTCKYMTLIYLYSCDNQSLLISNPIYFSLLGNDPDIPYPSWGKPENHRLKSAGWDGDNLVSWRVYQSGQFIINPYPEFWPFWIGFFYYIFTTVPFLGWPAVPAGFRSLFFLPINQSVNSSPQIKKRQILLPQLRSFWPYPLASAKLAPFLEDEVDGQRNNI